MSADFGSETVVWSDIHTFSESVVNDHVPAVGGIYVLYDLLISGKLIPSFVGTADNLRAAMLYHLSDRETNRTLKGNSDCFTFCRIATSESRAGVEKLLFDTQLTICEGPDPGGVPLDVTPLPVGW